MHRLISREQKKNRKAYLKNNGFETLEKYNEFVAEISKVAKASKDLDKKIKEGQASFDAVYARLDIEKDISQISLDPRNIEKAEKQFCDYDNADLSTRRKLEK